MKGLACLFLGVFVSFGLFAQTPTFQETVVITATGEPESLLDVPAAVTVVDEKELARSLQASLSELLRRLPGTTVLRTGFDGGLTSLFSRGTNSNHTLVLFEGVRLNDPYFGGYDWSLPLTFGVGSLEILRGPYSALYGSDALGGVVQFSLPKIKDENWQVFGEKGSYGWRRLQANYGVGGSDWDLFLAAGEREGTGPLVNDAFWGKAMTLSAGWYPTAGSRLGVVARISRGHTEIPFTGALATPHRYTKAREVVIAVPFRRQVRPGLEVSASLARVGGKLTFRDPEDPFGYVASDTDKTSWQARLTMHLQLGKQRLQVGGDWHQEEVTSGSNFGPSLVNRKQTVGAAFSQVRWHLAGAGELVTGLRYDRAGAWEEVSPRVVWSRAWGQTRVWASLGKGFRAPSLGELYYPFSGNAELQAERSKNVEFGLGRLLGKAWHLQIIPFVNHVTNLIEFNFASYRFANVATARQRGVEFSLEQRTGQALTRLAATWLEAEGRNHRQLLRRPRWSASFTSGRDFPRGQGELSLIYVGPRPDLDPVTFSRVRQGGFFTANAALKWSLGDTFAATVRAENLTDRSYQEVRGYPAPGRRVLFGLEVGSH
ncbi:MAG: TonB-dependent receptor plug domain-containing protein [Thermoanaerobaculaceae bacterium]